MESRVVTAGYSRLRTEQTLRDSYHPMINTLKTTTKGDACDHCHLCTLEEMKKRRNRSSAKKNNVGGDSRDEGASQQRGNPNWHLKVPNPWDIGGNSRKPTKVGPEKPVEFLL